MTEAVKLVFLSRVISDNEQEQIFPLLTSELNFVNSFRGPL